MSSRNTVRSGAVLLVAVQLLVGCGTETQGESLSPGDSSEELGSSEQAAVSTCIDSGVSLVQPDGAAVTFQYPSCSFADSAATSLDGTYDQPLCTHRFVTEVRTVNNRPFSAFVELIPAPNATITESTCEGQAIAGTAWGFNGRGWVQLGEISTAGVWHDNSGCTGPICLPSYCQFRFTIANVSGGYTKVRVAGLAAALGVFKGRVRTGVHAGPGPC
ncbi:hypothetical protein [Stigmatella aurantiaca]|uniref:Lipoprotein n=1 Tax=Stigmatella aurantiaca (strain DW4/3-1) TaxID=378806 RepID=Q09DJ0_STIAD|nr:hypothetical protein [Stigmatella aurantiaca]ADO69322.1 uncharacterized protein STAUR_1518 [Stigmatella aurantiaca DW4/3-1]EAU69831.1 hypothetical protein STIAU_1494 [Stigmatella aurantiaca DW4/3-1]